MADRDIVERVADLQDGNAWDSTIELITDLRDEVLSLRTEVTDLQNTIIRLTRDLGASQDYSRQQAQRQSDDDEFRMMQQGYRGQD